MGLSDPTPLIDQSPDEQEAVRRRAPYYYGVITWAQKTARDAGLPVPPNIEGMQVACADTQERWWATSWEHFAMAEGLLDQEDRTGKDILLAHVYASLAATAATRAASNARLMPPPSVAADEVGRGGTR